jgi:hypothetical protein
MVRELAERVANLRRSRFCCLRRRPERELARAVAEQVANLDTPPAPQPQETRCCT